MAVSTGDYLPEIALWRAACLVQGSEALADMPRKECQYPGCRYTEDLTEITQAEEGFCKCLVAAQFRWHDFNQAPP